MWKHGLVGAVMVGSAWGQVTQRVSVNSAGVQGNDHSEASSISADGRYVAFRSYASNLVLSDTNGVLDVFLRDRALGTTERVSLGMGGAEANGDSGAGLLSADARFVAITSSASNIVPNDLNGDRDVFVYDRTRHAVEIVSVSTSGVQGDAGSFCGPITPDARFITFVSLEKFVLFSD